MKAHSKLIGPSGMLGSGIFIYWKLSVNYLRCPLGSQCKQWMRVKDTNIIWIKRKPPLIRDNNIKIGSRIIIV